RTMYPTSLVDVERDHIIRTLEQVRGNKAVAARMLGISRRAFYRQLERHGLHHRLPMTRRDEAAAAAAAEEAAGQPTLPPRRLRVGPACSWRTTPIACAPSSR